MPTGIYQIHRLTGKRKSVLQNSLFPVHEEENYSELLKVKSFVICMQAIKQLCLMERRIKGLLVESMTKKDMYFEQKIHPNSLTL